MTDQSDQLALAKVYLANGQRARARMTLVAARQSDPSRTDLQVMLAEIESEDVQTERAGKNQTMPGTSRAALLLFIAGGPIILFGFTREEHASHWIALGGFCWVVSYFLVVIENYLRKEPVQTRGGLLRYEDGPIKYAVPYIFLGIFGLGALIMVLMQILIDYGHLAKA